MANTSPYLPFKIVTVPAPVNCRSVILIKRPKVQSDASPVTVSAQNIAPFGQVKVQLILGPF